MYTFSFFLSTSVNIKNATFVAEEIPKLVSKKITIVTDRENTVFNGIGKLLPNIYFDKWSLSDVDYI